MEPNRNPTTKDWAAGGSTPNYVAGEWVPTFESDIGNEIHSIKWYHNKGGTRSEQFIGIGGIYVNGSLIDAPT